MRTGMGAKRIHRRDPVRQRRCCQIYPTGGHAASGAWLVSPRRASGGLIQAAQEILRRLDRCLRA